MARKRNGTLYTGVTSDLVAWVHQHKNGITPGFASDYGCKLLVFFETHEDMRAAIARENQGGFAPKKLALIEGMNLDWRDLYDEIL